MEDILKWDKKLETGVEKIDEQHKGLFDRIYRIKEAGKTGKSADELSSTLLFFKRYVVEHFKDEEELQLKSGYPKHEEHKEAHTEFVKKVDELFAKCENEGVNLMTILETNKTVYDWLVEHINKLDMEFANYYKNR